MFLAKQCILRAYQVLSTLSEDHLQGATQKVSAIRYFFAMDAFIKQTNKSACDTSNTVERKTFSEKVADVVKVSSTYYTPNFYMPLKLDNTGDCATGSNFFSVSQVKQSKTNKTLDLFYPTRPADSALLSVRNGILSIYSKFGKPSGIQNIKKYFASKELCAAFFVWLARNWTGFKNTSDFIEELKAEALKHYSKDLVQELLPSDLDAWNFLEGEIVYDAQPAEITNDDIASLFSSRKMPSSFNPKIFSHQKIFYGAPGSGKSWKTNEVVKTYSDTIRTTFHPESDYSTFVGCYKPKMIKVTKYGLQGQPIMVGDRELQEDVITYKFVAQAFTKAYVLAWEKYAKKGDGNPDAQFLVIEEINRGNCAQIFGDLFQLLDRKNGFSEYPIEADADLMNYLNDEFTKRITVAELPEVERFDEIKAGKILVLPPNFCIWATMNTSDQSLFPMDSAFKRRWEWEYVPIKKGADVIYKIGVNDSNGEPYDWWTFLQKMNKRIFEATQSEDKKLGYFFAKPREGTTIEVDTFVNKVLFYLYNDVFKDEGLLDVSIGDVAEGKIGFAAFFTDDGEIDEANVEKFLEAIVKQENESTNAE